ncbi:MAG: hypothetical protein VXW65_00650 [Pseudomonadota bacterium]|nr:hypothetical protein [Pseudomonadota bacterium]
MTKGQIHIMTDHLSSDDSKQESNTQEPSMMHTILLIVLESLLTFLLRHDSNSSRLACHLIARNAVIRVRTHLPADTFYATFSHHGVLLDHQQPDGQFLATVDASIPDLVRAFLTAPPHVLDHILIHGEDELVDELRQLMSVFNLSHMIKNWFSIPWFGRHGDGHQDIPPTRQQRIKPLLKRIDEQKKQIEQFHIQVKQQQYELEHLQSKYTRTLWCCGVVIVLLLTILIIQVAF